MIVLDTTVLVYAVGSEHAYRDPCRRLLDAVGQRVVDARTTVEVLQEFVHVRARRRGREDAAALGQSYLTLLAPLLLVDESHVRAALSTYTVVRSIGMFDAVLATAAMRAEATLVSADAGFSAVPRLRHVVPTEDAVRELIEEASGTDAAV